MNRTIINLFRRLVVLAAAVLAAGCAIHPVIVSETVIRHDGRTVYSTLNPRLGEIVFPGLWSQVTAEVDVTIDGKRVGTIRPGGWIPVEVGTLGRHHVVATAYLVQGGRRADRIGCFSREFEVSPYYRTSNTHGFWWRVDVTPSPHC